MNRQQIQKLVNIANDLIKNSIDSSGDKILVVDKGGTWEEPMEYEQIKYSNGRLTIAYKEPYNGNRRTVEVISAANMEFDGIDTLKNIIKMYKEAMKKTKLEAIKTEAIFNPSDPNSDRNITFRANKEKAKSAHLDKAAEDERQQKIKKARAQYYSEYNKAATQINRLTDQLEELEDKRKEMMSDMENDPDIEHEGGPVANRYGNSLNKIDIKIDKLETKIKELRKVLQIPFKYNESLKEGRLTEARDNVYATYTQLKDRVIAKISAQKASVFTALAKQWKELESYLSELETKKRELNELKNKVDAMETEAKSKIRDKIVEVFDDSEQTMTLVVECLGSSFTLSKLTDANLPSTKTVSTTDYEKVVNLLLEQLPDLKSQVDILLKQCTAIQTVDVKGKERSVRVGVSESIITEGAFDKLKQWFINLKSKFLQAFDRSKFRQKKISQLLNNLKQTNENKITASEFKQMIREIIASELNKR